VYLLSLTEENPIKNKSLGTDSSVLFLWLKNLWGYFLYFLAKYNMILILLVIDEKMRWK